MSMGVEDNIGIWWFDNFNDLYYPSTFIICNIFKKTHNK